MPRHGQIRGHLITMSMDKREKYYRFDFVYERERHQGSTDMQNLRDAERVDNALKTDLARRKFSLLSRTLRFS